jgi:ABC-type sugar transport system substrate-binding protein
MQDREMPRHSGLRFGRTRHFWTILLAAAVTIGVAACGSSSSGSTANSHASGSTSPSASSTAGATSSACVTKAKPIVAKAEAPMTVATQAAKIDASSLSGKTIYFVSLPSGYPLEVWGSLSSAAKAVGLHAVYASGVTPEAWNTGIQQAVARHAAGIVLGYVTPSLIASSLAQAHAAGIPVISLNSIPPAPTGISATLVVPTTAVGQVIAAYAALHTDCNVHALIAVDPTYPGTTTIGDVIKSELQQLCPKTCTAENLTISLATMATTAAPQLESKLQVDPSINALFLTVDSMGVSMAPGLAQSSSKAKMYGVDGDNPNLAMVRTGELQAADYSYAPASYEAYVILDSLMRAMLKTTNAPPDQQTQLFTTANLSKSDSFSALWPKLVGFQSQFMKVWGLR